MKVKDTCSKRCLQWQTYKTSLAKPVSKTKCNRERASSTLISLSDYNGVMWASQMNISDTHPTTLGCDQSQWLQKILKQWFRKGRPWLGNKSVFGHCFLEWSKGLNDSHITLPNKLPTPQLQKTLLLQRPVLAQAQPKPPEKSLPYSNRRYN